MTYNKEMIKDWKELIGLMPNQSNMSGDYKTLTHHCDKLHINQNEQFLHTCFGCLPSEREGASDLNVVSKDRTVVIRTWNPGHKGCCLCHFINFDVQRWVRGTCEEMTLKLQKDVYIYNYKFNPSRVLCTKFCLGNHYLVPQHLLL